MNDETREMQQARQETRDFLDITARMVGAEPPRPRRRKRHRGGQPGNKNAVKHGFYARELTPAQMEALEEARQSTYLAGEMDILRIKINALFDDPTSDPNLLLRAIWVLARVSRIDDRLRFGT